MDPMSLYGPMMVANHLPAMAAGYGGAPEYGMPSMISKQSAYDSPSVAGTQTINFTDYDDDSSNYYVGKRALHQGMSASGRVYSKKYSPAYQHALQSIYPTLAYGMQSRIDRSPSSVVQDLKVSPEEQESLINDSEDSSSAHLRVRRQAYESSYENEPPCYGFPLEVNIKSRIKLDQVFPIHGKSQYKKCIKVG